MKYGQNIYQLVNYKFGGENKTYFQWNIDVKTHNREYCVIS